MTNTKLQNIQKYILQMVQTHAILVSPLLSTNNKLLSNSTDFVHYVNTPPLPSNLDGQCQPKSNKNTLLFILFPVLMVLLIVLKFSRCFLQLFRTSFNNYLKKIFLSQAFLF